MSAHVPRHFIPLTTGSRYEPDKYSKGGQDRFSLYENTWQERRLKPHCFFFFFFDFWKPINERIVCKVTV